MVPKDTIEQTTGGKIDNTQNQQITQGDAQQADTGHTANGFDEKGYLQYVSMREIEMLAYLVDKEAGLSPKDGGTLPDNERAAVVWCVLNRVDAGSNGGFRDTIYDVLTQPGQFRSYYGTGSARNTELVTEVLTLWCMEKQSGYPIAQRSLPRSFCWYCGNGSRNFFRDNYKSPYNIWDWSWG